MTVCFENFQEIGPICAICEICTFFFLEPQQNELFCHYIIYTSRPCATRSHVNFREHWVRIKLFAVVTQQNGNNLHTTSVSNAHEISGTFLWCIFGCTRKKGVKCMKVVPSKAQVRTSYGEEQKNCAFSCSWCKLKCFLKIYP